MISNNNKIILIIISTLKKKEKKRIFTIHNSKFKYVRQKGST